MVLAGLGFGYTLLRRRLLPAWTGLSLVVGVVLVATAQGLPHSVQLVAAGIRDLGFAGMGAALLRTPRPTTADQPEPVAATAAGRAKSSSRSLGDAGGGMTAPRRAEGAFRHTSSDLRP
jgi:hypothetical protein